MPTIERTEPSPTAPPVAPALSEVEADADWQQPPLLAAPARALPRPTRPNERLRQIGLVGIAKARAALAEASRRAQEGAETKAA